MCGPLTDSLAGSIKEGGEVNRTYNYKEYHISGYTASQW